MKRTYFVFMTRELRATLYLYTEWRLVERAITEGRIEKIHVGTLLGVTPDAITEFERAAIVAGFTVRKVE